MEENERDVRSEPVNEEINSDVAAASVAQSGDSASEAANKAPAPPRSTDDMLRAAQTETPFRCIRECLERAYDVSSIRIFCTSYFYTSVHKRIETRHGFDDIIIMIIDHCEQHGEMESFWQAILQDRPKWHSEYYSRWQRAVERVGKIERINVSEYTFRPDSRNEKVHSTENNPLDKNPGELTRWFFKELQQNERSLLLTTALFEGMSRQKMTLIATQLENVFAE